VSVAGVPATDAPVDMPAELATVFFLARRSFLIGVGRTGWVCGTCFEMKCDRFLRVVLVVPNLKSTLDIVGVTNQTVLPWLLIQQIDPHFCSAFCHLVSS
jgi:hypothetical protein